MSSSEQDQNCSSEEKFHLRCQALLWLGIHVSLHPVSPAGDSKLLSLQGCPSPAPPGACCSQAKNQGLESPKQKKGTAQGIKLKKTSCNCSQPSPLWGSWQGLPLRVGQSWTAVLQRKGAKSRKSSRNTTERTTCNKKKYHVHILCSYTSYK